MLKKTLALVAAVAVAVTGGVLVSPAPAAEAAVKEHSEVPYLEGIASYFLVHPNLTGREEKFTSVAEQRSLRGPIIYPTSFVRDEKWIDFFHHITLLAQAPASGSFGGIADKAHMKPKIANGQLAITGVAMVYEQAHTEKFKGIVEDYVAKRDRAVRHAVVFAPFIGKFLASK